MTSQLEQVKTKIVRPGTSSFIKSHLEHVGEDFVYGAYKAFCQKVEAIGQQGPSYDSFRKYWWICAQLRLIEFVREQPIKNLQPRRYYRLVRSNINNKAWQNPQAALDLRMGRTIPDPVTGRPVPVSRLGRRRYRRRVRGVPPLARGRPRKPKPKRGATAVATG
jgi:hypothetical protein